eukprot:GHVH01000201.1.p1 GENE.GHVH01000201.1~~GHVH01000201.1.p1  ORF type:complete len:422 (+),score=63.98 GHVH01000201.1:136-1401(+)
MRSTRCEISPHHHIKDGSSPSAAITPPPLKIKQHPYYTHEPAQPPFTNICQFRQVDGGPEVDKYEDGAKRSSTKRTKRAGEGGGYHQRNKWSKSDMSIFDIDDILTNDDGDKLDQYASVFNAIGETTLMCKDNESPSLVDKQQGQSTKKPGRLRGTKDPAKNNKRRAAARAKKKALLKLDEVKDDAVGQAFGESSILESVILNPSLLSQPLQPCGQRTVDMMSIMVGPLSKLFPNADIDTLKAIEREIYESIKVEPIAIQKPACKDEVRLRYRIKDCLWYPLIGTRHMKTFSTMKYGFGPAWALTRAVAYYMMRFNLLPPDFTLPSVAKWTPDVVEEIEYYIKNRLSGIYGDFTEPRKIPPKHPRQHQGRGRKRISNCAERIIYESYSIEANELSRHLDKEENKEKMLRRESKIRELNTER